MAFLFLKELQVVVGLVEQDVITILTRLLEVVMEELAVLALHTVVVVVAGGANYNAYGGYPTGTDGSSVGGPGGTSRITNNSVWRRMCWSW